MSEIKNLGPKSMRWLADIGVHDMDDLAERGAVPVYLDVRERHGAVTFNLLYALEAALRDMDWRELPEDVKRELRDEVSVIEVEEE